MDAATFRGNFSAFANVVMFPDSDVTYWLTLGGKLLPADRWSDLLDDGLQLFAAHNLVLERGAQAAAANGGLPGQAAGMVAGKTVDKVSVNYDTSAAMELEAGHWNLTIYGGRFIRLARLVGSGGVQF